MPDDELTSRMDAVERLVDLFYVERMVHLTVTSISLALLLGSAVYLIIIHEASLNILFGLFGSSGLIAYSSARLLRMWNQALAVLVDEQQERHV